MRQSGWYRDWNLDLIVPDVRKLFPDIRDVLRAALTCSRAAQFWGVRRQREYRGSFKKGVKKNETDQIHRHDTQTGRTFL